MWTVIWIATSNKARNDNSDIVWGEVAGHDWLHHLRSCMNHLGFESYLACPDLWMYASTLVDGEKYYEYVLMYVHNCLVVSEKSEDTLQK